MKDENKKYIVVYLLESDGDPRVEYMTKKRIKELGYHNNPEYAIIEGKVIKRFVDKWNLQ